MNRFVDKLFGLCLASLLVFFPLSGASEINIPVTLKVSYTASYDDNILKYSARDLDRFENNTEIYPSEITTTDDWVNSFSLRLYRDFDLGGKFKLRPYYFFRVSLYAVNEEKNLTSHFFLARLSYRYRYYFYLQYSYIPGYYLRIYKDRDLNQYHSCDFDLYRPTMKLRYRMKPFEIEGNLGREYIYYNSHFTEYDAEANFWGMEASYDTPFGLDVSLGYELKISDNVGFDQQTLVPAAVDPFEDTEYGDSSYEEDRFSLSLQYPLPFENRWNWMIGFDFERRLRYYQSELTLQEDPFHAGREDRRNIFGLNLSFSPPGDLNFKFVFSYDQRRTASPAPLVPGIKDFDNRTFELVVTYQVF